MDTTLAAIGITFGALASLPQIVKSCKTRQTTDLDARSMLLRIAAAATWGAWSLLKHDDAILYSAIANLSVEAILLTTKILYNTAPTHQ